VHCLNSRLLEGCAIITKADVLELKSLVHQLAKRDTDFRVFGSGGKYGGHYYNFLPAMRETDVAEFEKKHGVELPDDYKQYIVHVADGGVGPSYGLNRLEDAVAEAHLATSFPWTEKTKLDSEEDFELWDTHPGFLELCHHGCGYYDILIVSGATRGFMWKDISAATREIIPLAKPFIRWYMEWVEEKLRRLDKEPLVDKVAVGMPLTAVIDLLGPLDKDWFGTVQPIKRYVAFKDTSASFEIDEKEALVKVNRFSL
jgi:SMI1/KNR4 family protein SUKH-1